MRSLGRPDRLDRGREASDMRGQVGPTCQWKERGRGIAVSWRTEALGELAQIEEEEFHLFCVLFDEERLK